MSQRKKPKKLELNMCEILILGKHIKWLCSSTSAAIHFVFGPEKELIKKFKNYYLLLEKIMEIELPNPITKDIEIKFTSNELNYLWDVFRLKGTITSEFCLYSLGMYGGENEQKLIEDIISDNITYKDLSSTEKVYIYLYVEIALALKDNGTDISISNELINVRNMYIDEYLCYLSFVYELEFNSFNPVYYLVEPRYYKACNKKIKLKETLHHPYHLYYLGKNDFKEADEILKDGFLSCNQSKMSYPINSVRNKGNPESINERAKNILGHTYGPGWRVSLFCTDSISKINTSEDLKRKLDYLIDMQEFLSREIGSKGIANYRRSIVNEEHYELIKDKVEEMFNDFLDNCTNLQNLYASLRK